MIEKKISGNTIYLYDSIESLPQGRHHQYTKYNLMDLGIGSDMPSIAEHNRKLDTFLVHGKIDEAIQERKTQDLAYWYAINEISFSSYSFACMVYKINNDFNTDISSDGLDITLARLKKNGSQKFRCKRDIG